MSTSASPPPRRWTRLDIPITSAFTTDSSPNKAAARRSDDESGMHADDGVENGGDEQTIMAYHTFYGPGELETYRHTQLQQDVKEAKLKVWYPGRWHRHSPHACFRARLQELWSGGDHNVRETVLLKFRSNARILTAKCIFSEDGDNDQGKHQRNRCQLRWQSSMQTIRNKKVYDHILLLSPNGNIDVTNNIQSEKHSSHHDIIHDGDDHMPQFGSMLFLELDSRPPTSPSPVNGDSPEEISNVQIVGGEEKEDVCGNAESDLRTKIYPPPCITLQLPSSTFEFNNQHFQRKHYNWEWEWRNYEDEEWIPISSCWISPSYPQQLQQHQLQCKDIHLSSAVKTSTECASDFDDGIEDTWLFPDQIKLCQVSTVRPMNPLPYTDVVSDGVENNVNTQNAIIYDFGRELLGKVHVLIPLLSSSELLPIVELRVGETVEEAMNDEEDHFEQCLDLSYHLEHESTATNNCNRHVSDGISTQHSNVQPRHHAWVSNHLLAFRYIRVIIPNDYHCNATIACEVHVPLIKQCGTFSCANSGPDTVEPMKHQLQNGELDERIWRSSAYTLQCCVHNNFIVDGIKRDRLPWAGDLAVSLMANSYSFSDEECVRWTLTVLGRCGMDKLGAQHRNESKENDSDGKSAVADSHVNGAVDYSLWFIISHWLYQRYFGDIRFLQQEWRLIELRLKSLLKSCIDQEKGWFTINEDDWVFIDWTVDSEKSTALQILWWHALDCGISLAQKMVGLINEDGKKQSIMDNVSLFSSMQSRLEESFLDMLDMEDIQLGFSRHSHILGVFSGLYKRLNDRASEGDWSNPDSSDERWHTLSRCRNLYDQTQKALMSNRLPAVATPYMKHLETLVIARLGERISALRTVRLYWGGMLENNATTFFEAFHENETLVDVAQFYDRPFGRSLCHAWAAGPCALYPEILLGLRPSTDGWEQFICDPLECLTHNISATIKTKYGVISVHLDLDNLEVFVPEGSTMILMDKDYSSGKYCLPRKTLISSHAVREWSKKYRGWHHCASHVIAPNPMIPGYEDIKMTDVPTIYQLPGDEMFYMSFIGFDGVGYQTFCGKSSDLLHWNNFKLAMGYGEAGSFDHGGVVLGAFLMNDYAITAPRVLKRIDGKFFSLYGAYEKKGTYEPDPGYQGLASSEDGLVWKREKDESILSIYGPGVVASWEKDSIYQPWLVEHDGVYYNFYNAKEMPQWVEQIGLATSKDLHNWTRHEDNPILRVGKRNDDTVNDGFDTQFASDAKVFWDGDESHWVMLYFGVGKSGAHGEYTKLAILTATKLRMSLIDRLCHCSVMVAFSRDLIHWVRDPIPLYPAGANPSGIDKQYAHKTSLVWNPVNETWYMFYCAVGDRGRGIGLITSRSLGG
ncbi:hypothetical protein ACHAXR_013552 [Thalassiosira sp. AJA248-18]